MKKHKKIENGDTKAKHEKVWRKTGGMNTYQNIYIFCRDNKGLKFKRVTKVNYHV